MGLDLSSQPLRTCSARRRNEQSPQFLTQKSQCCCRVVTSVMLHDIDISPRCNRCWWCGFCCSQRENMCWNLRGWLPALRGFKAALRSGGGGEDLQNPRRDFQLLRGGKGFGLSSSVGKHNAFGHRVAHLFLWAVHLPTAVRVSVAVPEESSLWKAFGKQICPLSVGILRLIPKLTNSPPDTWHFVGLTARSCSEKSRFYDSMKSLWPPFSPFLLMGLSSQQNTQRCFGVWLEPSQSAQLQPFPPRGCVRWNVCLQTLIFFLLVSVLGVEEIKQSALSLLTRLRGCLFYIQCFFPWIKLYTHQKTDLAVWCMLESATRVYCAV